jgi:hypothetical protein
MWLGQDETVQGVGCPGGCQGTDGQLYEWVQGVDGLGTPVGFWRPKPGVEPGAPYVRNAAPFLGHVAQAADGQLYQWVQGVDGLGTPFGFWKRLKRLAKRALPIAQRLAPFVPGGAAALTMATPLLRQAGIAGLGEVGALYAAADGSLYQLQGIGADESVDGLEDDELRGLSDDEVQGLEADEELRGFGAGDDLNGMGAEPDLDGFAATEPLDGIGADELDLSAASDDLDGLADDELQGMADDDPTMSGYVRDAGMSGVEGYLPDAAPQTPQFSPAPNAPMWAPLW